MNSHEARYSSRSEVVRRRTRPIESSARPSSTRRRHGISGFASWTLPLVTGLWLCGAVSIAPGQETARTLVSNTGQTTETGATPVLAIQSAAMQFSTGASASPWTLTAIELDVGAWDSGATPTVSLHGASGQSPGASIATLTNPAAGTGLKAFTSPAGSTVTLQANTTYTVVIESDTTFLNYNGFTLRNTESAAEDSGGASGWEISDSRLTNSGNGWTVSSGGPKLRMAVLGTGGSVSDDATLSSLVLADDSGNAIALDRTFNAATTSYTASVAWSVSTVAVTATATHANATVSVSDDDDDTTLGTATLDLDVGANTVTVAVTAEDTTTTNSYTVVVTRAAPPAHVPRTLVGNTGQSSAPTGAPVLSIQSLAMQFTTGSTANRWTLTAIQLEVTAWQSGVAPTVSLHTASGQTPGARIATLTNPAYGTGSKTFTVPSASDVRLQANTTYTVVIESANLVLNGFTLSRTDSTDDDSGGASGWQIADNGLSNLGQGWSTGNHRLKLAVIGTPDSDDATLGALTLADADDGEITLDPTFAAGTTDYSASVANSVSTVSVTATANHAEGTVSITDDDDDATPGTAELDLDEGENTVTVTVTAPDGAATSTYTVAVTRAAATAAPDPTQVPQTLVGNISRPRHAAVEVHKGQRRVGIKFTTGDSTTAWTLASIRLHVTAWHASVTPTAMLRRVSGRWPGATIATLTNPSPGTGSKAFTAPSGLKLQPNTTYGVVIAAGVRQGRFNLGITKSNHEDGGGAAGWSIADTSRAYASGRWSGFPQSLMLAVQGTAVSNDATSGGLTGWVASSPAEHDGSTTFTVRIGFSDPARISLSDMQRHAVAVSGGSVASAKRVFGDGDLWDIRITPTGLEDITATVEGARACDSSGAICTSDGNALAETLTLTVPGPLALSVADARAREGTDTAATFPVTLNRAFSRDVTVDYATADGTARAGEDYTATSGTLTFAAGVVEQSVEVPVLDDATDEAEETFTLTLSNASRAVIGDGEATGTIANSDPMPRAWLTRFGRTVAEQSVGAIGARMEGAGGFRVVVGGLTFDGTRHRSRPDERHEFPRNGVLVPRDGRESDATHRSMSARELLAGSTFQLGGGHEDGSRAWGAWGQIASSGFEATQDDVRMDGDVTTAFFGADISRGRWLAGLAVGLSEGDGSFELLDNGRTDDSGDVESSLTSLYPYARYSPSERTDIWALAGHGTGEFTLTEHADDSRPRDVATETDISMRMAAIGARSEVLSAAESGGVVVAIRSDAFWVRTESEEVTSARSGRMAATSGDANRLRLVLRGSRAVEIGSGGTFTPSAEIGVRHDGGDAETGTGIEAGAGVALAGAGFAIAGRVRSFVAHESGSFQDWAASGSVRIDPGASGRGMSLTVAPSWGSASSGVERLWSLSSARELARDGESDAGRRLDAEVGYGLGFTGARGVVTPYTGLSLANGGSRAYRTGARWTLGRDMAVRLEGVRESGHGHRTPDHTVALHALVRW